MTTTEAATLLADSLDRIRYLNLVIRHPPVGFVRQDELNALDEASNNVRKAIMALSKPHTRIQNLG